MALLFCAQVGGKTMEKTTQANEVGRPFGEQPERREPAQAARPMFSDPAVKETRTAQPAVAGDGQLVELGYGHGV
jgi:hypothetical protein